MEKLVDPKSPLDIITGVAALINTVDKTRKWMYANKLCLNDAKTEFIVFGLKRYVTQMPECTIKIGEKTIHPVKIVKKKPKCFDGYAA